MTQAQRDEAVGLAQKICVEYFCNSNIAFLVSTFAPDIVWLGGGEDQRAEGAQNVAAAFWAGESEAIPYDMTNERYVALELKPDCYLVEGESDLHARPESGMALDAHQRVTFIFRRMDGALKCAHIHNSMPFNALQPGELFPVKKAREDFLRLQQAYDDQNRQMELILSQLPGGAVICRLDEGMSVKWATPGFYALLGYAGPADFAADQGGSYASHMDKADARKILRQIGALEIETGTCALQYRIRKKDGGELWVLDSAKKVRDVDGESVNYSFVTDITQRVAQQLQLENQARFLRQLYDTVPCGICQFSIEGEHELLSANQQALAIYGYEDLQEGQTAFHPLRDALACPDRRVRKAVCAVVRQGGSARYQRQCVKPDGGLLWVDVHIERIQNAQGRDVIQMVVIDITEQKRYQQAQEQERLIENRSLRAAICTAYPVILQINLTKDSFTVINQEQGATHLNGLHSYQQMVEASRLIVDEDYREDFNRRFDRRQVIDRFRAGERELYAEMRVAGEDGARHWIALHLVAVDNPYNDDVLAIELIKLLDEQRAQSARQEQLLRDALAAANTANKAKSDFLSRMSHDIRTPMNAIIGMSAIGLLKAAEPDRVRDCFQKIDLSSKYLLTLINDILDMSRIESGKMNIDIARFDFEELIDGVDHIIYPQAQEAGLHYEVYVMGQVASCYEGDALRINQVLINLLGNAVKFTPAGGRVTLTVREKARRGGHATLQFVVADTGQGMSEAFQDRMFQPFEQERDDEARNSVGSGLGLSIVYNIVQLMEGSISVQSQKGKGTAFTVSLPLGLSPQDEASPRQESTLLEGMSILIADDDPVVGEQAAALMAQVGARAQWVDSGQRAVQAVQEALAQDWGYDVALIDWKMPGMDGVETTRRIRALVGPETTIIIISAYDWSDIEQEARRAGADLFIPKPLFRDTLYRTLRQRAPRRAAPQLGPQAGFAGKRVLLVEDNLLNREIAKSLLEMQGLLVEEAPDGAKAVDAFAAHGAGYYAAILMDIRMPVMGGLQATSTIRALTRADAGRIPIIAMSANAFEEDKRQAAACGMDAYLVKPIDVKDLTLTLGRYLTQTE